MLSMPDTVKEALNLKLEELGKEAHNLSAKKEQLINELREIKDKESKAFTAVSQFQQYFEGLESNGNKLQT